MKHRLDPLAARTLFLGLVSLSGCTPAAKSADQIYGERVNSVLEGLQPQIRECYEAGAASQFGLVGGFATVRFIIGLDGEVETAELVHDKTDLNHPPTLVCIVNVIRGARFPLPSKRSPVVYPMEFGW